MEAAVTTLGTAIAIVLLYCVAEFVAQPASTNGFLRSYVPFNAQVHQVDTRQLKTRTITTTNCDSVRVDPYPVQLTLLYEYSVEAEAGSAISLDALEQAIVHTVANELNMCDGLGQPLFSVKESARHSFSKTEFCAPTVDPANTCQVVTGATSILVFDDSAFVRMEADRAVRSAVQNGIFFEVFAGFVVRTEYRGPISETIVYSPDNGESDDESNLSPVTTTVAVAAASLAFFVASLFCYGMMRKDFRQRHPEPRVRHQRIRSRKLGSRAIISGPRGGGNVAAGSRRSFVRLEDFAVSPTSYHTEASDPVDSEDIPVMTWSVSDITSDSASVVSKTTSMLERIDEEKEEEYCNEYYDSYLETEDDGYDADSLQSGYSFRSGLKSIREVDEVEEDSEEGPPVAESRLADYDCIAERNHELIDLSDLDAVFSINSRLVDQSHDITIDDSGNVDVDITPSTDGNEVESTSESKTDGEIDTNSLDDFSDKDLEIMKNDLEVVTEREQRAFKDDQNDAAKADDETLHMQACDQLSKVEKRVKPSLSISLEKMKDNSGPQNGTPSTANSSTSPVHINDVDSVVSGSSSQESTSQEIGSDAHSYLGENKGVVEPVSEEC